MSNSIYVKEGAEGIYEEKKSRFIAKVYSVSDESEIGIILEASRKKYWDARHNCYAYVLGASNEISRFSDDGEPSGTAGKPILEVIQGFELHNCLIVVTRYFGGTLLGTGGLIRAYTKASRDAVTGSRLVTLTEGSRYEITIDYQNVSRIQRIAADFNAEIKESEYAEKVIMRVVVSKNLSTQFCTQVTEATSGKAIITFEKAENIEETYFLSD